MFKNMIGVASAIAMATIPVAASAANPAQSLSVAKSVRASAPTTGKNKAVGGGVLAALIAAGVVAIGVIAIVNDSNDDNADSN